MFQDLRYGVRMLFRQPGFTIVAVLTLALGIGANTAIFSVVYGVLFKPLPYTDADRIVVANISAPDFRDLKEASQVFDRMAIWASNRSNVTVNDETTQITSAVVSPEFFTMLGQPAIGRVWRPDEDNRHLAVISHDFWRQRFGGDPNVSGKTVRLYGDLYTVIGVMPPEFRYPTGEFKLWSPFGAALAKSPRQAENRQLRIFRAVAHLKSGATPAQMRAETDTISRLLEQQHPDTNRGVRIDFRPLYDRLVGGVRQALLVLLGTVGFVLLIACANVANLQLTRAAAREREIAIRTALGAGRRRLIRLLLTESLLLAAIGGLAGLLIAMWGIDVLPSLAAGEIPRLDAVGINLPVLLFAFAVTALTGILSGVIPAWQSTRGSFNQSLKEGGRGAVGGAKGRRLRGALVVAEIALSLVVLIGAGLLVRSFIQLVRVDAGFVTENLLTLNVGFVQLEEPSRRVAAQREIIDRISQIPGVQMVGGATGMPPTTPQRGTRFAVQGSPDDNAGARSSYFIAVSPDYFRLLGAPQIEGREFSPRDDAGAPGVVVINRTLARSLFPNETAVGKRLQLVNPEYSNEWREIVGVVGDIRYNGLGDDNTPTIYTPFAQTPFIWNYLMIRTNAQPESLTRQVRQAVSSVDSTLEVGDFRRMNQLISESVAQPRFYTLLLGAFGALALTLATVGIYGVISYSVSQRRHEIGVRMALGARAGEVLKLIIRQGMALALIGVGLGLIASLAMTWLLNNLLFGVSATDPLTFAVIALLLMVVALLACWIPARRAAKVDPMIALRYE